MRSRLLHLLIGALAPASATIWLACGASHGEQKTDDIPDAEDEYVPRPPRDAANDTGDAEHADVVTVCDPSMPFLMVTALPGTANTPSDEASPTLTDDELTLYFQRGAIDGGGDGGSATFFVATRAVVTDAFGAPAGLTELEDGRMNTGPAVTAAGDALFLASDSDIRMATRNGSGRFDPPAKVAALSTSGSETAPALFARGEEVWFSFSGSAGGGPHLRRSTRLPSGFTAPEAIPELDSVGYESGVASTRDGLTVYFGSQRDGGLGNGDIWMARRKSRSSPFTTISAVTSVSSGADEAPGWLSADGCRLYFASSRLGSYDLFVASRPKP
jgi:hypothetical protein